MGASGVTAPHYGRFARPRYSRGVEERYESELAQSTRVLDDVDRALERLTSGAYGSCETCGAVIPDAHLAADPTRRVCDRHGTAQPPSADGPDLGTTGADLGVSGTAGSVGAGDPPS